MKALKSCLTINLFSSGRSDDFLNSSFRSSLGSSSSSSNSSLSLVVSRAITNFFSLSDDGLTVFVSILDM